MKLVLLEVMFEKKKWQVKTGYKIWKKDPPLMGFEGLKIVINKEYFYVA